MSFSSQFLHEVQQVATQLEANAIERAVDELAHIRERGTIDYSGPQSAGQNAALCRRACARGRGRIESK